MQIKKDFIIFLIFYILYGIIAVVYMQMPDWDWFNYRLYNVWAFLNDRYNIDFEAANHRTYLTPYLEIPQYYFLKLLNNHGQIFVFLSTFDSALVSLFLYKITDFIFKTTNKYKNYYVVFCVLFAAFSPLMFLETSFDQNDIKIAAICLFSFYILITNIFLEHSRKKECLIAVSGLLLGVATGLKLIGIIYCISLPLCLLIFYRKIQRPFKIFSIFVISVIVAFFVVDGYWLYKIYSIYKNPFFPYFNNIFHSPYADIDDIYTSDFMHLRPRNILEFLLYPFRLEGGVEREILDLRYAFCAIAIIGIIVENIFNKIKNIKDSVYSDLCKINHLSFVVCYIVISYYTNILLYSAYRYIIATSILFGIPVAVFIYILVKRVFKDNKKIAIILLLISLILVNKITNIRIIRFVTTQKNHIIKTIDREIKDNSVVLLGTCTTSFIAPFQNPKASYMGFTIPKVIFEERKEELHDFSYYHSRYIFSDYLEEKIRNVLNSDKDVYVVRSEDWKLSENVYIDALNSYLKDGIKRELVDCREATVLFDSNWNKVDICEYKRK